MSSEQKEELTPEQKEQMQDIVGRLKQIGNSILETIGLSTDDFVVTKDEITE